jgi:hypothetical protein
MAWTLAELSKIETDPLRKGVVDTLLMESDIMQLIPWETTGTLSTTITRIKDLPTFGYRKVNAAYSESTGHFEQKAESICLGGLYIDTDKAIARAKNTIADARAIQQMMSLKSAAYAFNDAWINGNPTTNPEVFKGLAERTTDIYAEGYTDQKFACNSTSVGILNSSATRHAFLNDVDKLLYAIQNHSPEFLFMGKKLLLAFRALLRMEKLLEYDKDMFGRVIDMYQTARLVDIGTKSDETTDIITSTETTAGALTGGTECTSLYACKLGIGDLTWGIQEYPMEVTDHGLLTSAPVYRTEIDWPHGLATSGPRSLARMYGIVPDASA